MPKADIWLLLVRFLRNVNLLTVALLPLLVTLAARLDRESPAAPGTPPGQMQPNGQVPAERSGLPGDLADGDPPAAGEASLALSQDLLKSLAEEAGSLERRPGCWEIVSGAIAEIHAICADLEQDYRHLVRRISEADFHALAQVFQFGSPDAADIPPELTGQASPDMETAAERLSTRRALESQIMELIAPHPATPPVNTRSR